jgi:hypothetical protein
MNLRYLVIHQNKILFFENKKCWARGGVMGDRMYRLESRIKF